MSSSKKRKQKRRKYLRKSIAAVLYEAAITYKNEIIDYNNKLKFLQIAPKHEDMIEQNARLDQLRLITENLSKTKLKLKKVLSELILYKDLLPNLKQLSLDDDIYGETNEKVDFIDFVTWIVKGDL